MPTIICSFCSKPSVKTTSYYNRVKKTKQKFVFCSMKCSAEHRRTTVVLNCSQCGNIHHKPPAQLSKRSGNSFCSLSCAATFNNQHKTTGTRRSKLEYWLERELTQLYPHLVIRYNGKEAINSELDIYIPDIHLAFELNGVFHYEPIYGSEKLMSIQNNDTRKFQACLENGIELCIIDSSSMKNFKEVKARVFLNIIIEIINAKISCGRRESNPLSPKGLGVTDR